MTLSELLGVSRWAPFVSQPEARITLSIRLSINLSTKLSIRLSIKLHFNRGNCAARPRHQAMLRVALQSLWHYQVPLGSSQGKKKACNVRATIGAHRKTLKICMGDEMILHKNEIFCLYQLSILLLNTLEDEIRGLKVSLPWRFLANPRNDLLRTEFLQNRPSNPITPPNEPSRAKSTKVG